MKKPELVRAAEETGVSAQTVEKDWVIGWVLAGIYAHPVLRAMVFKGGTCLKKCWFKTYRFSEDLDFTVLNLDILNAEVLERAFTEAAAQVRENSGMEIIVGDFDVRKDGKPSCEGRLRYRGPLATGAREKSYGLKIDITAEKSLALPPVRRPVHQPYSGAPAAGIQALCYAYAEIFAEKICALVERRYSAPRDLYDVVFMYEAEDMRPDADLLLETVRRKCVLNGADIPVIEGIASRKETFNKAWDGSLEKQFPKGEAPLFHEFWEKLPTVFDWLHNQQKESLK